MPTKGPRKKLGHVAEKVIALLRRHRAGLSMREMRRMTGSTESQEHFNRRVRDIRKHFHLETRRRGSEFVYILGRQKPRSRDAAGVSERLRAEVIHAAHGRCQMCGSTIAKDLVKLQADHRIPQSWGGRSVRENLWAICEACNRGKRHFFSSFDKRTMRKVLAFESVHERIAEMLHLNLRKPVPSYLLEFVANAPGQQEDWHKRLRELRYPPIGLKIDVSKKRTKKGVQSFYTLLNWKRLPPDHKVLIREHETRAKAARKRHR